MRSFLTLAGFLIDGLGENNDSTSSWLVVSFESFWLRNYWSVLLEHALEKAALGIYPENDTETIKTGSPSQLLPSSEEFLRSAP